MQNSIESQLPKASTDLPSSDSSLFVVESNSVFTIDTLRVYRTGHQFFFDNFATPAQAENFRRQFRKIISKDLVRITCGKSKVDKSKFPPPFNPANLDKGRIEVTATAELFDIVYVMLEMALSLYIGKRKLFVYDVETKEIYQPSSTKSFNQTFPAGEAKRFGKLHLEVANPYNVGNSNTGYNPPVSIIQVDSVSNQVMCNTLPFYTPINTILDRLSQFTDHLNYELIRYENQLRLKLHLNPEDMFLVTVMLFYALDMSLIGYRMLISPDLFENPQRSFEISQVL